SQYHTSYAPTLLLSGRTSQWGSVLPLRESLVPLSQAGYALPTSFSNIVRSRCPFLVYAYFA
ncbi:MAG: hypothetical protein RLP02_02655, partial [Coleofasciculus sp. C2-GNP5-27]